MFHLVRGSVYLLVLVHWSCDHFYIHYAYLWYIYIYDDVCLLDLPLHVLFLFYLYIHVSYFMYAIFYFCFILRCRDEFCLKCFKNIGCQSLPCHELSSFKIFQSLCYDRFYCIQQMRISWVIYDFSHISFVCCGFVTDCQRGRLLGHIWFDVRNICQNKIG